MSIDPDATGAHLSANLFLPETDAARVCDHGHFATLRLGDHDNFLSVYATGATSARELADTATMWAELTEARDRGENVEQWGTWLLPSDTFGGAR